MKLQQLLFLIFVPFFGLISTSSLAAATDDVGISSDALRGSVKKRSEGADSLLSLAGDLKRNLQFFIMPSPQVPAIAPSPMDTPALRLGPLQLISRPERNPIPPPISSPVDTPTLRLGPLQLISRPERTPVPAPTPSPVNTPTPVAPIPPIREQIVDVNGNMCGMQTPGTVILHGGIFNYEDPMSDSLGQAMLREMGTNSDNRLVDPLVFLPGARREVTDIDEETFEDQWRNIMADGVAFSVLHPSDRDPEFTDVGDAEEADQEDFVRPLRDAKGVFLPGGRQWRLIDAYKYTDTEEELWNVLKRGGVLAGTSAGAAVMASFMPRGDPDGSVEFLAEREWYQHGFGFVSNIAVDNHVSARGRELSMYEAMNSSPENRKLLGIGLNENTMVIVKDRYFNVQGDRGDSSIVRIYDCTQIGEIDTCNFDNAPYTELRPGDWYDLCSRRQLSSPPSLNSLDEDAGVRSDLGAYGLPYQYKNDFKAGNPGQFLCSGRRCRFKSNPIVVDSIDGTVRVVGRVFSEGTDFGSGDRLQVRYSINEDKFQKIIFDTSFTPEGSGSLGQTIFSAIPVPNGKSTVYLEIEAESAVEGDAQFRVQGLGLQ